ncbi:unnamed protein product [Arabidopsis lyrata]|uniref:Uncharacterized protein n=1 Tax=Arabidopsis lyrata subsp. lyrata TaxID=81972 RepID=D7LIY1_ARALL|nr:hypothetical protein ARALYDRAFT_901066 [Arabidopsis lyrata subsp. lyrata]CAH8263437.1 unnamed protein product [Arabidopsis lyrata]
MARILNSICFISVFLITLLVSTDLPKSEAKTCKMFRGECPVDPCDPVACDQCCNTTFGKQVCGKCEQEGTEFHCHCRR